MQGAERGRVLGTERVAAARDHALVDRAGLLGPVEVGEGYGQTVRGGESVQVARPEDALAALQQDGVLVTGGRVVVELEPDRRDAGFGLERRRVLRSEKLAARVHDLTAKQTLDSEVREPL